MTTYGYHSRDYCRQRCARRRYAFSGALAPPAATALVPCGTSLTVTLPAEDPSHPGQFSPERGPCDDSAPATPPLQPPALILPA